MDKRLIVPILGLSLLAAACGSSINNNSNGADPCSGLYGQAYQDCSQANFNQSSEGQGDY